jgi:uncharacterized protein (TIGR03067 family)
MKREWLAAVGLVALCGSLARGDAEQHKKEMQGTWLPQSAQIAGKPYPQKLLKVTKLTIKDDHYLVTTGDGRDAGTLKLDASKTPHTMDINSTEGPNKGRTILTIYELNGDTLRVCYDLSGKARPTEFTSTSDNKWFLMNYKREKP